MSLRMRMFLLIGGLFLATLLAMFLLNEYELQHTIRQTHKQVKRDIANLRKEKLHNVEQYLIAATNTQGQNADILLQKLYNNPQLVHTLRAGKEYPGSWYTACKILLGNPFIDFIEWANPDKTSFSIRSIPPYLEDMLEVKVDRELSVFILADPNGDNTIFFPLDALSLLDPEKSEGAQEGSVFDSSMQSWFLFSYDQIKSKPFRIKRSSAHEIQAIQNAHHALSLLDEKIQKRPSFAAMMASDVKREAWVAKKREKLLKHLRAHPKLTPYSEQTKQRYAQMYLLTELCRLLATDSWGSTPFAQMFPLGMCMQFAEAKGLHAGSYGLLNGNVFAESDTCCDKKPCYPTHAESLSDCLESRTLVMARPSGNEIFVGDSIYLQGPGSTALTVGHSIVQMVRVLAMTTNFQVLLLYNNDIIQYVLPSGHVGKKERYSHVNWEELLQKDVGVIQDNQGMRRAYVDITPIEGENLHFVLINPGEDNTAYMTYVDKKTHQFIRAVSYQLGIIVVAVLVIFLWSLNRVIRKITHPVLNLADVTEEVGRGNLNVQLDPQIEGRSDEIGKLYKAFGSMVSKMKQGEEVRGVLNKVVSPKIAEKILDEGIELKGEMREVTILFADIRHFTEISEVMGPQDLLAILNEALDVLTQVIDSHGGVIDKYLGDGVMALFGAPLGMDNAPLSSVECAWDMVQALKDWNRMREEKNFCPLDIGIGIHKGSVIAGNVGTKKRMSYSVLGYHVNLAARVGMVAGEMEIVVSEEIIKDTSIVERFNYEPLASREIRGVTHPPALFRIVSHK